MTRREQIENRYGKNSNVMLELRKTFVEAIRFGFWFHSGESANMTLSMAEEFWEVYLNEVVV